MNIVKQRLNVILFLICLVFFIVGTSQLISIMKSYVYITNNTLDLICKENYGDEYNLYQFDTKDNKVFCINNKQLSTIRSFTLYARSNENNGSTI